MFMFLNENANIDKYLLINNKYLSNKFIFLVEPRITYWVSAHCKKKKVAV